MKRPWDVRYHYSMCWLAGLMPVDGIYFCILLSSQNSEVSIYIVPNTCRWCEASMGCQLSVPHVWSRWFDARGLHIFLYTNFKSKLWSVHDVKMMWSVHGMSGISTAFIVWFIVWFMFDLLFDLSFDLFFDLLFHLLFDLLFNLLLDLLFDLWFDLWFD